MADVIHTPEPPADAGTVTPGLLRRIIAFPLTLMVIEFAAVVLLASLYSTAVFRAGMPKDGPLHLFGALVLAAMIVALWKACSAGSNGAATANSRYLARRVNWQSAWALALHCFR